jgi:D-lactate dehydrogenase (quinone)
MALYARIDEAGEVQLINRLGVKLGDDPEKILEKLDREDFTEADIDYTTGACCLPVPMQF